ncbi:hypothetical protein QAD02_018192 [Eretmocerus hayati]|uniref:Uncharacterized protein n=1 Tax=Eretmocerus hayati TaxID=131215 RepID=A0ACC2PG51_9HYME|nr:hypothetical protein QAD02_018192 [Eretmocerus hayati]
MLVLSLSGGDANAVPETDAGVAWIFARDNKQLPLSVPEYSMHPPTPTYFDTYYQSLLPRVGKECDGQEGNVPHKTLSGRLVNCRNAWFREFWAQHHRCTFSTSTDPTKMRRCNGTERLVDYKQEGLVPFVMYAMAHAVHNIINDVCVEHLNIANFSSVSSFSGRHQLCDSLKPAPPGQQLLQYIRNVTFVGRQGTEIKFNADGDAYGYYNIYQYQRVSEDRYNYTLIGSWKERLDLEINMTKWSDGTGEEHVPRSICSDDCPLGQIRNFMDTCCWSCVACREDAYVFNDSCRICEPGWAPDDTKSSCVKLNAEVIEWTSPWAMVPLGFASIGILCTIFVTVVFIWFNRTPVIMASGRELCYVLLVGILSCYLMSFVILSRPTKWICTELRIGLGLCLSLCYSAILTKTNRISRIFNQGRKSIKRPSYTSPKSQVAISVGITSVQLIGAITWLIIEPPDTSEIYPSPLTAVLTCRVSTFALMMSLVYNMLLILMCTLYAFKTRKIPENFNEAKYIGFTMYSTCIVWLAFIPIYFGTNNDYKIQIASMCMCINISATVALGCLFTPKVYIVLFQPNKNQRLGPSQSGGQPSGYRAGYSMRFSAARSQTMQSVTSGSRSSPPPSAGPTTTTLATSSVTSQTGLQQQTQTHCSLMQQLKPKHSVTNGGDAQLRNQIHLRRTRLLHPILAWKHASLAGVWSSKEDKEAKKTGWHQRVAGISKAPVTGYGIPRSYTHWKTVFLG